MCVIVFVSSGVNNISEVELSGLCLFIWQTMCLVRRLLLGSLCLLLPSGHVLLSLAVCPEADISKGEMVCA